MVDDVNIQYFHNASFHPLSFEHYIPGPENRQ